jgi:Bacterial Ig-like domain
MIAKRFFTQIISVAFILLGMALAAPSVTLTPNGVLITNKDLDLNINVLGGKPSEIGFSFKGVNNYVSNQSKLKMPSKFPYQQSLELNGLNDGDYKLFIYAIITKKVYVSPTLLVRVDRVAPSISKIAPSTEEYNVNWDQDFSLQFNEPIKLNAAIEKSLNLAFDGSPIDFTANLSSDKQLLKFKLKSKPKTFPGSLKFTSDSITDLAGNKIKAPEIEWQLSNWKTVGGLIGNQKTTIENISYGFNSKNQPFYAAVEQDDAGISKLIVRSFDGRNWAKIGKSLNIASDNNIKAPYLVFDSKDIPYISWVEGYRIQVKKYISSNWEEVGQALEGYTIGKLKFNSENKLFILWSNGNSIAVRKLDSNVWKSVDDSDGNTTINYSIYDYDFSNSNNPITANNQDGKVSAFELVNGEWLSYSSALSISGNLYGVQLSTVQQKVYLTFQVNDNTISYLYEGKTWQQLGSSINRNPSNCFSTAIDRSGNLVVSTRENNIQFIRIWNGDSWREVARFATDGYTSCLQVSVGFDGLMSAVWTQNGAIVVWNNQ